MQRRRAERCSSALLSSCSTEGGKFLLKTLQVGGGLQTGKYNIYLLQLAALQMQHRGGGRVIRLAGADGMDRMEKDKEHLIRTE